MKNIIEVNGLIKKYGLKIAVNDLSFVVKEGSLFSFLGSNGAGKTTTINILTTLLKKDFGSVKINDYTVSIDDDLIRNDIGIVFQDSVLDNNLTVLENIMIRGSFYYKKRKILIDRVDKIIEILKLKNLKNQKYGTLSGGEKRRVDIARALVHKPKILFLDEPTTGLDPTNRKLVWDIIKKLQKEEKITVFLTTHYMEEAIDSDFVGIIEKGSLIAYDTPNNLKIKFTHDILKIKLIDKKYEKDIKEIFEKNSDVLIIKTSSSLEAFDIANKYRGIISSVEIISGNMDDVFLSVTGSKIEDGE